ncbi:hypothetical protein LDL59_00885 [Kaistella anthropi]|nr:hypothetical protein [Kaistella anthropi]
MPNTANAKLAIDLRAKLLKEKENFAEVEKKVETRKKNFKKRLELKN